jgi:hypothetical protein
MREELRYRPVHRTLLPEMNNHAPRGLIAKSNLSEMWLHETYRGISANKFWNARVVILGAEPDFPPLLAGCHPPGPRLRVPGGVVTAADPTLAAEVSSGACPTISKLNFTKVCSPLSTTPNNSRQSPHCPSATLHRLLPRSLSSTALSSMQYFSNANCAITNCSFPAYAGTLRFCFITSPHPCDICWPAAFCTSRVPVRWFSGL